MHIIVPATEGNAKNLVPLIILYYNCRIMMEYEGLSPNEQAFKKENSFIDLFRFTIFALAVIIPIRLFIITPFVVDGASMEPSFQDQDYLVVEQLGYHLYEPNRGDVVIFRFPLEPEKFFIKRIIAVPGDTIIVQRNRIIIQNEQHPDGFELKEPYLLENKTDYQQMRLRLEDNEYFVMGDNRDVSFDSRRWGALPKENIIGRALLRLYPLESLSLFPGTTHDNQNQ